MQKRKTFFLACLVFLVMALALPLMAQGTRIKVIVENASIRLKPSLDSEAIEESVALNTVFTAEKKVGEWYEVKFESTVGVLLIGYIHEMYVEVLAEEARRPPALEEKPPAGEVRRPEPLLPAEYGPKKMEIFFGGGLGFGSFLNDSTVYDYHFGASFPLDYADEAGQVSHKAGGPMGLGFSLAHFFSGGLGLRLRIDFNFSQNLTGGSSYSLTWKWWDKGPYDEPNSWDLTGNLSVIPISLNVVYKFDLGMISPYISAGPSFFLAKLKADSTLGCTTTWIYGGYMYIDYFAIPMFVDESLNGIGFNFGAGLDVLLSPSFGLTVDIAYFLKGEAKVKWDFTPGEYDSHINSGWTWTLDKADLADILDYIPDLSVNLSFFKIQVGLKIFL
ncbi:MAG: hypothetical protein WCB96_14060 [Candidatus Aminicenantales bacterium]